MTINEIDVLNFDDLDVRELEQRLDQTVLSGAVLDSWECPEDGPCPDCSCHCGLFYCEVDSGCNCAPFGPPPCTVY